MVRILRQPRMPDPVETRRLEIFRAANLAGIPPEIGAIAAAAGISRDSISDWIHGYSKPSKPTLARLADVLQLLPQDLSRLLPGRPRR